MSPLTLTHNQWVCLLVPPEDITAQDLLDGQTAIRAALHSLTSNSIRTCRVVGRTVCVLGWWPTAHPEWN